MENPGPSRYVDYTQPGPSSRVYRPSSVSSYEYYPPPEKPPRREKHSRSRGNSRDRSRSRSRSRDSSRERYHQSNGI